MYLKFIGPHKGLVLSCAIFLGILAGCGGNTTTPTPTVAAPTITTQPVAQGVTEGGSAAFSVSATGTGALSYQWKKGSADLTGKTSSALALNPVALTDAGSYTVVITNTTTGGSASITSNAAILTVNPTATTPIISAQPAGVTVTEGGTANFSVTASGNGALTYQWKKGGSDLLGKTASS
ncbi:MAG: immunoglobulin domain-containing protein, partial [Holophaga sp.]